jgi:hypothetical protein
MKTKRFKFLFLFIFILLSCNIAKAQGWLWAKALGGLWSDNDNGAGIIASEDIYVYGTFESLDCYTETDTFHIQGGEDIFFAKFDKNGSERWCRRIGGFDPGIIKEQISKMILDPAGEYLYITGYYKDSIIIGAVTLHGINREIFIAKFDTSGSLIWAKSAGGIADDSGSGIALDSLGNIYLSAFILGQATFDSYLVQPGTILAKYDTSGNCLGAKNVMKNVAGGALFKNNYLYFVGVSLLNSDTLYIDSLKILGNGSYDIILSKFDTTGKVVWAIKEGWTAADATTGFAIDESGNIFLAGSYGGDSTIINGDTLRNGQAYLMKYNSSGTFQWIREFTASNQVLISRGISVDHQDNVYVTGFFSDTATFGNFTLFAQSVIDAFLVRYSSNGNCIGADNIPFGLGKEVAVDINDRPVITGPFSVINTAAGTVNSHGLVDAAIIMHDVINGVTETEKTRGNELLIYSNPTTGKCNITMPDEFLHNGGKLTLTLYDSFGKVIRSYLVQVKDGTIKLNLDYEAAGIYIITLTDGHKLFKGKIIFE